MALSKQTGLATTLEKKSTLGRYRALSVTLVLFLAVSSLTRIILAISNYDQIRPLAVLVPAVLVGVLYDLVVGFWVLLPFGLFLLIMPDRWLNTRGWRWTAAGVWCGFVYGMIYLGVVEWFFFGEFSARFNTVAVDYLIFPQEVFVNLWETYPVWQALIAVLIVTVVLAWKLLPKISGALQIPTPRGQRFRIFGIQVLLIAVGTLSVNPRLAHVSENRVANEIALNGIYSFTEAALTNELDYDSYYVRLDDRTAFRHLRNDMAHDNIEFLASADSLSIDRFVNYPGPARPLNVVVVLEESFGSRFVKSLDAQGPGVTPEFEKLADSGVLFTNIFATGNRTVRGMEALLASFPPIPGQSIVRRPGGKHVFTLPALLKSFGYQTAFIYGGFSYFDNMGEFASSNGFDRVIDRTELSKKTFATVWGVCDEDLFDNSLHILDTMYNAKTPFFTLLLTVSNHSPYTFPDGRVNTDPKVHIREHAVRYMDWALARFLHQAEDHAFFDSTLFVVMGDHGARVYGSQQIPMTSYRIPVLLYAPAILPHGERIATLGSQLDVGPTIMGVLNRSYASQFFGQDLRRSDVKQRALLSHNRDVALLRGNRMAVLSIQQEVELYQIDSTFAFTPLPIDQDTALINDAIGYYQSAYHLYKNHQLHPLPQYHPKPLAETK